MLKEKRQFFEYSFMGADLFVVSCSWCLAYWLRFCTDLIPPDKGVPPFQHYLLMLLFVWPIWAFVFRRMGLYRPMRSIRRVRELLMLLNANAFAVLLLIALTYLFREKSVPFSRLVFLYFWLIATVFTMLERGFLRFALHELRRRGHNLRYMLIVGAGAVAGDIATRVRLRQELGIQLLGCLSRDGQEKKGARGIKVLGSYSDLARILDEREIDQLVIALPLEDNSLLPEIMSQLENTVVDVKIVPDIYQFVSVGGAIEEFDGLPVISVQGSPIYGINLLSKRLTDLTLAGLAMLFLLPFLCLLAAVIKLTSRGPVLYRQERVSLDGTPFHIYKFRTMRCDAEEEGPQWVANRDRMTWIGRFMRATSIDELPQLYNVIRGDMSLVGPRPERPVFIEEFKRRVPGYMLRHKVPAGMTGWAQVNGWRGDTSIDKRIEFDLYYIRNWSLALDLRIMWMTLSRGAWNQA